MKRSVGKIVFDRSDYKRITTNPNYFSNIPNRDKIKLGFEIENRLSRSEEATA